MEFWSEILVTLRRNRWRSLMTMFGVFWGIWMLVTLTGVGQGISNQLMPDVSDMPTNSLTIHAGTTTLPYQGLQSGRAWKMRNDDLEAVANHLGDKCRFVIGMAYGSWTSASYEGHTSDGCSVRGVMPNFLQTQSVELSQGRYINDIDLNEHRNVCVIGEQVHTSLFPDGSNPCGCYIKVGSIYYMVVGVLRQKGDFNMGPSPRNSIFLPLTTVQLNYHRGEELDGLIVNMYDDYPAEQYEETVGLLLKQRHQIAPQDRGAMWVMNLAQFVGSFRALFLGISILLWIVGLGMLLSGLIGIGNIMLVTVKERTQEIGVRRAIGAKPRLILMQIMMESLLLTAVSGLAGLVCGVGSLSVIDSIAAQADEPMMQHPQISFTMGITALMLIVLGGLAAGFMPAHRAMKIKAIDALRDE